MARRCSVLLDDERAGAHAANRELLVALDRDILDRHAVDLRSPRPRAQECDQLLDARRETLGVHRHAAVVGVAHPAAHAQASRPPSRRFAKADPLHGARDGRPDGASALGPATAWSPSPMRMGLGLWLGGHAELKIAQPA